MCRWGYKNVDELVEVVARYKQAALPLEAMWTDIDYMDGYRDFSLDPINFSKDRMQVSIPYRLIANMLVICIYARIDAFH